MVRDEAPAATTGGFNERECDRAEISSAEIAGLDSRDGPTSLVAAEIHLGRRPAGICGGWLHCNIQVACHHGSKRNRCKINWLWD
jgi:hypothetical protein